MLMPSGLLCFYYDWNVRLVGAAEFGIAVSYGLDFERREKRSESGKVSAIETVILSFEDTSLQRILCVAQVKIKSSSKIKI